MLNFDVIKDFGYEDIVPYVIYLDGTKVILPPTGLDSLNPTFEGDRKLLMELNNIQNRNIRLKKIMKLNENINNNSLL